MPFRKIFAPLAAALSFAIINLSCFKKQDNDVTGAGEPLFTLAGKIFDVDNNRIVQNAVVQIKTLGLSDTVDANGAYHFVNLQKGARSLEISAPNYATTAALVSFDEYEQRDVVQDIAMTKLLEVVFAGELPFTNASGIWWENRQLVVTRFDSMGGSLYRMDENLNVLQKTPRFGTLTMDTCFVRVDTCFWRQGNCSRALDPNNPFTPDSITTDSVFIDCQQRLYGLTRAEEFFYTSDGHGHFSAFGSLTPIHIFKIDPLTLVPVDTLILPSQVSGYFLAFITDLAWDGSGVWLCNRDFNNFPKVNVSDFSLRAVFAGTIPNATGLTWDGGNMWIANGTEIVQYHLNRGIRNHYKNPNFSIEYIAWEGEHFWAIQGGTRRIYKLALPFEDHL